MSEFSMYRDDVLAAESFIASRGERTRREELFDEFDYFGSDKEEGGDIAAEDNSIIEECQEEAEESTNNEEGE